jgi:hypothetical protein
MSDEMLANPRTCSNGSLGTGFAYSRAANLYAQAVTWSEADISGGGDLPAALAAIQARVLSMPSGTDVDFRVAAEGARDLGPGRARGRASRRDTWN